MLKKSNSFFVKLRKFKNNTALISEKGEYISYLDLLKFSKKISKNLHNEKKLVFLLGQNNVESIAGYISFVNKGYAVVMIDYRITQILLKKLISIYKPKYIFCEKDKFKTFKTYKFVNNFRNYLLLEGKKSKNINLHEDLMLLMSTSGSTGSPKLVKQSYLNIKSNTKQIIKYLKIKSQDKTITSLPISYVYGLSVINTHLFSGATIILTNKSMVEREFWELIKMFKVNNFSGVPYNYSIIERISKSGLPESLNYTTQAGGKMNYELIKKILAIYKKNNIKLIQMYGAAEATSRMSYLKWQDNFKKIGSIGKPIPGGKFFLADKHGKYINKINKKGELVYKGKNVCMGYAQKISDLSLPDINKSILFTGDLAYKDKDGYYFIIGRKDRYMKVYGSRINLSELENILLKKGVETIMKEGIENKIEVYCKKLSDIKINLKYLSKVTSININVFDIKKISKKNLTKNFKYKI
tara:strand:+ start:1393 stop:2799 length:1407 start_codon:yes stop_codon:yes gene_type:complete